MNAQTAPDVVVAGAGIAGAAIAAVLARAGHSVTMLEATREHVDRVRGEFIVPWGVAETRALGLHDLLVAAGGRHMRLNLPYGEGVDPAPRHRRPRASGRRASLHRGHAGRRRARVARP